VWLFDRGRSRFDSAQHWLGAVVVGVGLYLAFVPPGGAGLSQRTDQVGGGRGLARAADNDVERPVYLVAAVSRDVVDEIAHLVGRWGLAVPRGLEQRHRTVPLGRAAHRSAVGPVAGDPHRRSGALDGCRQQCSLTDPVVPPVVVHCLAGPVAAQQSQALVEPLGEDDRVGGVAEARVFVFDRAAQPGAEDDAATGQRVEGGNLPGQLFRRRCCVDRSDRAGLNWVMGYSSSESQCEIIERDAHSIVDR
jgi:hypothetical protein